MSCFYSTENILNSLIKELAAETQIPDKELKRSLLSLAMGKPTQRILCRKGYGREIG